MCDFEKIFYFYIGTANGYKIATIDTLTLICGGFYLFAHFKYNYLLYSMEFNTKGLSAADLKVVIDNPDASSIYELTKKGLSPAGMELMQANMAQQTVNKDEPKKKGRPAKPKPVVEEKKVEPIKDHEPPKSSEEMANGNTVFENSNKPQPIQPTKITVNKPTIVDIKSTLPQSDRVTLLNHQTGVRRPFSRKAAELLVKQNPKEYSILP